MNGFRLGWAALIAAFFLCSNSWADTTLDSPRYLFPDSADALEDGDIVLTNTVSTSSILIKEFGRPTGRYTHAAIYVEFSDKTGKIVSFNDHQGIRISDPSALLNTAFQLALLRPNHKQPVGAIADALEKLSVRPLVFDFDMRWPNVDSNLTYCAGFLSQLIRLSSQPENDPFPLPTKINQEFWSDWANKNLNLSLDQIISPNAVLSNSQYKLIAEYQSKNTDQHINYWINDTTLHRLMDFIRHDHLEIAPPKLGSRLALAAAKRGYIEELSLLKMPEDRLRVFMSIRDFLAKVDGRVKRFILFNDQQEWDEAAIRTLTMAIADFYRDDFFLPQKRQ